MLRASKASYSRVLPVEGPRGFIVARM